MVFVSIDDEAGVVLTTLTLITLVAEKVLFFLLSLKETEKRVEEPVELSRLPRQQWPAEVVGDK